MQHLTAAILFAADAHVGQLRKDGKTPYINHPLQVMNYLTELAAIEDQEMLMAAVLHDVVEDTHFTRRDIEQRFGVRVATIVEELTDDKHLDTHARKQAQLVGASNLSYEARLIRISDKICNVSDIIIAPPDNWVIERKLYYLNWANSVIDIIRGTELNLENRFDFVYNNGIQVLTNRFSQ
jgi:guanosine-3',5'-bis(diphosphate) 3'-pyrophosphohydrolase